MLSRTRALPVVAIAAILVSCSAGGGSSNGGASQSLEESAVPSATAFPVQTAEVVEGIPRWSIASPHGIGYGLGAVWVSGHHSESVFRIDPQTNDLTNEFAGAPFQAQDVLVAFDSLWVPGTGGPMIRMEPSAGTVLASYPKSYSDAEAGFESVWAVSTENELEQIDPTTNQITQSIVVGTGGVDYNNTVAVGEALVWVAVPDDQKLLGFDPATGDQMADVDMGGPGLVAAGGAGLWVALEDGTLLRIDEQEASIVVTIETGSTGYNLVEVGDDAVWFAGADQILRRFDHGGVEQTTIDLGWAPEGLVIAEASAWVEYYGIDRVERIELDEAAS